jgi:hypothetical protein
VLTEEYWEPGGGGRACVSVFRVYTLVVVFRNHVNLKLLIYNNYNAVMFAQVS